MISEEMWGATCGEIPVRSTSELDSDKPRKATIWRAVCGKTDESFGVGVRASPPLLFSIHDAREYADFLVISRITTNNNNPEVNILVPISKYQFNDASSTTNPP